MSETRSVEKRLAELEERVFVLERQEEGGGGGIEYDRWHSAIRRRFREYQLDLGGIP